MAHNCVDWAASGPIRRTPLLILTCGDDRVYTIVPKEFKTLEEVARREFGLGDGEIKFSSSCVNLCNGLPARITESVWEHISLYIGCASVEVCNPSATARRPTPGASPERQRPALENADDERAPRAKKKQLSNDYQGDDRNVSDHRSSGRPARATVRDAEDAPSDRENERGGAEDHQCEEPWEEEVSAIPPRKSRIRRRMVSEDEEEGEDSQRECEAPVKFQVPAVASPPEPPQPSKDVKKECDGDYTSETHSRSAEPPQRLRKAVKKENRGSWSPPYSHQGNSQPPHAESQPETRTQPPAESGESQKLMIRVAHRASKQESKFTTKSTTKVTKVVVGACKSFGLDATRATLYLIVSTEDEDGVVENLFPCDKNDTIARAGAEHDAESKFLLKIAGEA